MSQFSEHSDKLKYLLTIATMVAMYGAGGMITWYLGSSYGLSTTGQIILVVIILATFPLALLINKIMKRRSEQSGQPATTTASSTNTMPPVPLNNYPELTGNAEEAMQWLRSSKLSATKSKDVAYRLPWFLVAGLTGSGKTSLLLSTGCNFHVLSGNRNVDQRSIKATQNCDWRIADQAVWLDTAGRYQSSGADRDEWQALLEILKSYRRSRPIDGLMLVVNTADIINSSEDEIEQQAKLLRVRLDETIQRVQAKFPVYLIFTHSDLTPGFAEFFQTYDRSGRAQVWGTTIPLEQSTRAHALFDTEFDYLCDVLTRHRMVRLSVPATTAEQLRVFDFPLKFAALRDKLGLFISALFRPNPFSESPLLRGFYFTSTPASAAVSSVPSNLADKDEVKALADEIKINSKGYFVEDLFQDVLLRDRDLAASFQHKTLAPNQARQILITAAMVVLCCLIAGFTVSLFNNRRLLAEAQERGAVVDEFNRLLSAQPEKSKEPASQRAELEAIETLRELIARLDKYQAEGPPLSYRFGLYSGNSINPQLRAIYFDAINRRFFKTSVVMLETDLRKFTAGSDQSITEAELGKHYDLLKSYLMLSQPDKAEPVLLAQQLSNYWLRETPEDLAILSRQQLEYLASTTSKLDAPHIQPDQTLVAEARKILTAYPAVNRFYKRITSEIDTKVPPVTVDTILQGRGRGWISGSYTVPGSFTITGYHGYLRKALGGAAAEMSKEDWVMGTTSLPVKDQQADIGKLQSLYFRDYTAHWQRFTKGVIITPYKNRDDALEALKLFSASDSPIAMLAQEIARQNEISRAPGSSGIWGWFGSLFGGKPEKISGTNEVEKEFKPLIEFVAASDKDVSPVSQYRASLRSVLDVLETTSADQLTQTAKLLLTGKDDIGLTKAEVNVKKLTEGFKTAAATDALALLRQPLGNLRGMLYGGGYEQIEKSWREQLYSKAHTLESGFPFTSGGEAAVTDLSRFLNPVNGQFTTFFNDKLASSLEDAQGKWRLKETGAFKFSPEFINYLNGVRQLRDAIFPQGGQQPEVGYEVMLQPVSGSDVAIEIDGIRVETRGTTAQSAKFVWPARAGASGAKIIVIKNGEMFEKSYPGEWGLFRMFAAGGANLTEGNQYQLSWNINGVPVRAIIRPSSAINPFQRNLFTQLHAPESLRAQ